MKKLSLGIMMVLLACATMVFGADAVPAAAPTVSQFGQALNTFFVQTAFPIFGALVLGFASWALGKLGTKFKIQGLQDKNSFLMQLAGQGVAFAEEKAANFAKSAQPLTGNDKLNAAIAYMLQNAPKLTEAQAQSLVTSALASIPGVGATSSTTVDIPAPPVVVTQPVRVPAAADALAVAP
jgi:hypothetical protein